MTKMTGWDILLVDDEPDSLHLINEMLVLNGANVHQASTGGEGLAILENLTPTIAVLDLSMPKPDGWDLLAKIRALPATLDIPVVAVTAFYSEKVREQAFRLGFNALIPKPIRIDGFLSALWDVVGV